MNIREIAELRAKTEGNNKKRQYYSAVKTTLETESRRLKNFPNAHREPEYDEDGRWFIPEAEGIAWATNKPLWYTVGEAAKAKGCSRNNIHENTIKHPEKFDAIFPNRRKVGRTWLLWHEDVKKWIEGK